MIGTVLFLISCVVTARLLDKKNMRVASVSYAVMFAVLTVVLLFTVDAEPIRDLMVRLVGRNAYVNAHFAFREAINSSIYGIYIVSALTLTFILQLFVTVFYTAKTIVTYYFKKNSFSENKKKVNPGRVGDTRRLYLSQKINKIFCRMLN